MKWLIESNISLDLSYKVVFVFVFSSMVMQTMNSRVITGIIARLTNFDMISRLKGDVSGVLQRMNR